MILYIYCFLCLRRFSHAHPQILAWSQHDWLMAVQFPAQLSERPWLIVSIILQQIFTSMHCPHQWNIIPYSAVTGLGPMTCFGQSNISRQRPLKISLSLTWLLCALVICHEKSFLSSGCAFDLGPRADKYRADVSSACNLQTQMTPSFPAKISWATADLQNFLWGTYTFGGILFHFVSFVLWSTEGAIADCYAI